MTVFLGLLAAAASAGAPPSAATPKLAGPTDTEAVRLVVPDLTARGVSTDLAASLTEVVLTRLAQIGSLEVVARRDLENLLDQEKERMLAGCGDDTACLAEIAGALDATRLLTGSVGRIGERYLLSLALLDTTNARLIRRISREAIIADNLVDAAKEAVRAMWSAGEVEVARCVDCDEGVFSRRWEAAVKIGNTFSSFFQDDLGVSSLALSLDIDVGYRVWESVAIFGSVGMRLNSVERTMEGDNISLQVLPLQVGARYHTPPFWADFSAYFAGAVGLGFLRADIADREELAAAFSARIYAGVVYAFGTRVGALLEVSYELASQGTESLGENRLDSAAVRLGLSYGF